MQKEKLEQLRNVSKSKIEQYFVTLGYYSQKRTFTADDLAKGLVYEVKTRINNKGE